jgi:hypothetical protein
MALQNINRCAARSEKFTAGFTASSVTFAVSKIKNHSFNRLVF